MRSQGESEMVFILDNLAVGSYMEALEAPSDITALLCVAQEKDIYDTRFCEIRMCAFTVCKVP